VRPGQSRQPFAQQPTLSTKPELKTQGEHERSTLKTAHEEIVKQRNHIGDLETEWAEDSILRITTENTTLNQQVRQLANDNQTLDDRLKAARSNVRFQDRRIVELEVQLLDSSDRS
jgi:hypothetical protein